MLRFALALYLVLFTACSETSTSDCVSNRDCAEGQLCIAGACQGLEVSSSCSTNADCATGFMCDATVGMCLPSMATPECTDDSQCQGAKVCDLTSNACVDPASPEGCVDDQACADGRYCETNSGQCVQCLIPSHCSSNNCVENVCVDAEPECTIDTECDPPNTICEEKQCVLGCNSGSTTCPQDTVCDTMTGRCVPVVGPCQSDSECSPPMRVCEFGQCVPGCAEFGGIQCVGDTICESASGRCVASNMGICRSDTDCNPPQTVCDVSAERCVEGCLTAGCAAPLMCNMTTGHCVSATTCTDDSLEDNDSATQASSLTLGGMINAQSCSGDDDYYQFNLAQAEVLNVALSFTHGEGDINVELIYNGGVVASGQSTTNNESIVFTAMSSGLYSLRVFLASDTGPNPGNSYQLSTSTLMASCGVDMFEDNDAREDAVFVAPDVYPNLNVCPNDADYYRVLMNSGDDFTINVNFSHAEGDIDVRLLNVIGFPVGGSNSTNDNETATYSATRVGTLIIEVSLYGESGSIPGNPYTMEVIRQ